MVRAHATVQEHNKAIQQARCSSQEAILECVVAAAPEEQLGSQQGPEGEADGGVAGKAAGQQWVSPAQAEELGALGSSGKVQGEQHSAQARVAHCNAMCSPVKSEESRARLRPGQAQRLGWRSTAQQPRQHHGLPGQAWHSMCAPALQLRKQQLGAGMAQLQPLVPQANAKQQPPQQQPLEPQADTEQPPPQQPLVPQADAEQLPPQQQPLVPLTDAEQPLPQQPLVPQADAEQQLTQQQHAAGQGHGQQDTEARLPQSPRSCSMTKRCGAGRASGEEGGDENSGGEEYRLAQQGEDKPVGYDLVWRLLQQRSVEMQLNSGQGCE